MVISVYLLFLISSFFAIIAEFCSRNIKKILIFLIFLFMVLLAIFRDGDIMPDYKMYNDLYRLIISESNRYPIEVSFAWIAKFSNLIFKENFLFFLAIYAILGVGIKIYLIGKFSPNKFYSILLLISNFYLIQDLVQIRASVAIGLIYLGIYHLLQENKKLFFTFILLATFFHFTSIFFILIYYVPRVNFSKLKYIGFIIAAYLFSIFGYLLLEMILNYLPISYFQLKLLGYLSGDRVSLLAVNVFGVFIMSKIILFGVLVYFRKLVNIPDYDFLLNLYLFGIVAYVGLSGAPDIAVRLSYVFFFSEIFLITYIMTKVKPVFISNLIMILFALILLYSNITFTSLFKYEL